MLFGRGGGLEEEQENIEVLEIHFAAANLRAMNEAAIQVYRLGHLPVLGRVVRAAFD